MSGFEGLDVKAFSARSAVVEVVWIDKVHTFKLGLDQLFELDELTGFGPYERLRRLRAGEWNTRMIRETIRLALIGGGMEPTKALVMCQRYVDPPRPLGESVPLATLISTAAVLGVGDDPPKKSRGADRRGAIRSRTAD